jgi:tetratricopeptide (TPR) repeat protein
MKAKQKPYFVIGWFYFLGTLVPTIGLVQVGSQSMADRYVYIPSIGLFIVLVWGIQDLIKSQPNQKFIATVCSTASLAVCLLLCKPQIAAWQNSITLYSRALRAEPENYLAYDWLGAAVRDAGAPQQALDLFLESVKLEPHYNPAEKDLAVQLLSAGRVDEALDHLRTAVALDPADPGAQQNLGVILVTHGKIEEGIPHFEKALALEPYSTEIINQLAWIYATGGQPKYRNGARAVQLARDACQRTQNNDSFSLRTLAVAYAETGDFTNAQATLEKARIMAVTHQKASTLKDMPAIQQAINSNQPYRDPTLN